MEEQIDESQSVSLIKTDELEPKNRKMEENKESIDNVIDLPFTRRERSKSVHEQALERRMEIIERVIQRIGFLNARLMYKGLAEQYKVAERTIHRDFKWIKGNIQPENLQEVKIDLKIARGKALQAAMDACLQAITIEDKVRTSSNLMNILKGYREELEGWGEKGKVPDPQSLVVQPGMTFNLIERSMEDIKNERRSKEDNKTSV